jgi:hypothetical protein
VKLIPQYTLLQIAQTWHSYGQSWGELCVMCSSGGVCTLISGSGIGEWAGPDSTHGLALMGAFSMQYRLQE